jgi:predicted Rossmann fold nucleotide-binding protein DprA/Smf involved in DNA uptake
MESKTLSRTDAGYPFRLRDRLGEQAPATLTVAGNLTWLSVPSTALFCSVRCPGDAILGAYDTVQKLRDEGVTIISGFHSPVEKECVRILLRGKQPIIICLARSMTKMRIPGEWRPALDAGRLLVLSAFKKFLPRPTTDSARHRNESVAALCNEVLIIHANRGGGVERLSKLIDEWRIPKRTLAACL